MGALCGCEDQPAEPEMKTGQKPKVMTARDRTWLIIKI